VQEFRGRIIAADWCIAKQAFTEHVPRNATTTPAPHELETHGLEPTTELATPTEDQSSGDALTPAHKQAERAVKDRAASTHTHSPLVGSDKLEGALRNDQNMKASINLKAKGVNLRDTDADAVGSVSSLEGAGNEDGTLSGGSGMASPAASSENDSGAGGVSQKDRETLSRVLNRVLQDSGAEQDGASADGSRCQKGNAKALQVKSKPAPTISDRSKMSCKAGHGEKAEPAKGAENMRSGIIKTQVFVRNVPVDSSSIELQTRLQRFGAVKACRCGASSLACPCLSMVVSSASSIIILCSCGAAANLRKTCIRRSRC
jgi:hypothetical protein